MNPKICLTRAHSEENRRNLPKRISLQIEKDKEQPLCGSPEFRLAAAAGRPFPFFTFYICLSDILLFCFFKKRQQRFEFGFRETCQGENFVGSVFMFSYNNIKVLNPFLKIRGL